MAFDTKPNLSNAKFEQFAGETLTLSGRTEIHGIIEIENSGILRLDDGNQAVCCLPGHKGPSAEQNSLCTYGSLSCNVCMSRTCTDSHQA